VECDRRATCLPASLPLLRACSKLLRQPALRLLLHALVQLCPLLLCHQSLTPCLHCLLAPMPCSHTSCCIELRCDA
jgi:hypothetical protein